MREEWREQPGAWKRPAERRPAPGSAVSRRRARRRLTRHAALGVAAIAVAAVSACASANPSAGGNSGAAPTPSPHATWYPAGGPSAAGAGPAAAPYFVTLAFGKLDVPAVVTDAVTGKVLGTVHPPTGGTRFVSAAAAGDDRTFILAAEGAYPAQSAATRFYELRLGPAGTPRPLSPLPVPAVAYGDKLAVSADGSKLAIATGTASSGHIEVVSLATGTVRVWGSSDRGSAASLSWADNRWLAFDWSDASRAAQVARQQSGLRLLDTTAPGTDLMSSRLVVSQSARFGSFGGLTGPLITPDGSKVFATMVSGVPANPVAEVVEFSARTGQPLGAVTPPAGESGTGQWCGALWTDPSGQHLLAACGGIPPGGQGRVDNGHFTRMNLHVPTYNFSTPRESFIAW
jgi:hypothetical protein